MNPNPGKLQQTDQADGLEWPVETEIYILPGGEIVVADMPAELAHTLAHLAGAHNPPANLPPVPNSQHDEPQ